MAIEKYVSRLVDRFRNSAPITEYPIPSDVDALTIELHARYKKYLTDPLPDTEDRHELDWNRRKDMAEFGRAVGERIDRLSDFERKAYVAKYCQETGFPNTANTSKRILTHFTDVISNTVDSLRNTVVYAGYANTCSVGKRLALPGSDVDVATIIVKEEDCDITEYESRITRALNPRLTDVDMGFGIFTPSKVREFLEYLKENNNKIDFKELPQNKWSSGELFYLSGLVTNVRTGSNLINNLGADREQFKDVKDQRVEADRLNDKFFDKEKHGSRKKLIEAFPNLTPDEQFTIVRIMQIDNESIALNYSEDGPHAESIKSLQKKGLLGRDGNNLKAPWAVYPWLFRNKWFWFYSDSEV